jgi:hypothetical protein
LTQVEANGSAANNLGKVRRIPDNPIGKHVLDSLPMGLRYLLMWKLRDSCGFVAVCENCGNHTKPPATRQAGT